MIVGCDRTVLERGDLGSGIVDKRCDDVLYCVMTEDAFEIPFDGTLDLHTFAPGDVKSLVPEFIDECVRRRIVQIRIVHGKGTGTLRRIVHAELDRHPAVVSYRHEGGSGGSWGATVADLENVGPQ